jgi:methyl-accepting chemotaxis protein
VAAEVRNLAQRSAGAAKDIKGLISDSVEAVGQCTKLVDETGKTFEELVSSIVEASLMIEILAIQVKSNQRVLEKSVQPLVKWMK